MKNSTKRSGDGTQVRLLEDILITLLLSLGAPQLEIRKLAGVGVHRVSRIGKVIRKSKKS